MKRLTPCPVCKVDCLTHALNCHITQSAGREAQREMAMLINTSRMKPRNFSPRILMTHCPHWSYFRKMKQKKWREKIQKSVYDL